MIKLNRADSSGAFYVSPEHVVTVGEGVYGGSICTFIEVLPDPTRTSILVAESAETVARLITEYKQRQMRLQAAYTALYKDTMGSYLEEEIISQLESEDRGE